MSPVRGTFASAAARAFASSGNSVTFPVAGAFTWTVPSNVTLITATVIGAGGNPGAQSTGAVGGGGGGAGAVRVSKTVTPGTVVNINVDNYLYPYGTSRVYISSGVDVAEGLSGGTGGNASPGVNGTAGVAGSYNVINWTLLDSTTGYDGNIYATGEGGYFPYGSYGTSLKFYGFNGVASVSGATGVGAGGSSSLGSGNTNAGNGVVRIEW